MDFGLFHTWNVLYEGGKVPWDPEYRGGKLLEEAAYTKNWEEMQAVEAMGSIGNSNGLFHWPRAPAPYRAPWPPSRWGWGNGAWVQRTLQMPEDLSDQLAVRDDCDDPQRPR